MFGNDRIAKQNQALRALDATLPPVADGGDLTVVARYGTPQNGGKMNVMTMKLVPMTMEQWVLVLGYYKKLVGEWAGSDPVMDADMMAYLAEKEKDGTLKTDDSLFTS